MASERFLRDLKRIDATNDKIAPLSQYMRLMDPKVCCKVSGGEAYSLPFAPTPLMRPPISLSPSPSLPAARLSLICVSLIGRCSSPNLLAGMDDSGGKCRACKDSTSPFSSQRCSPPQQGQAQCCGVLR